MELPVRIAVINKSKKGQGLKCISLVDAPAIGFTAVKMAQEQSTVQLSIHDEEQRIIFTPVLIPGQLIYRNYDGYEFYLKFEAESIEEIQLDWTKRHLHQAADINHSQNLIDGVVWFESFLLDNKRVQKVAGFENMPQGTWFVSGKVEDDNTWLKIKSGEIKGVSIDGHFDTILVQQSAQNSERQKDFEEIARLLVADYILKNYNTPTF